MIEIFLLGGFHLALDGKPVKGLDTPRLQTLIAYLVLKRPSPVDRQQLAATFWPEASEAQARTNLRHLLHTLRSNLPDADRYLSGDRYRLAWSRQAALSVDVEQFEAAVTLAEEPMDLQCALDGFTGDLLPACYDDWILSERERLSQFYQVALERLSILWEKSGEYAKAIQAAQRLLQREPLQESIYSRLINLYISNGDRAGALYTYQTYTSIYMRDLGLEPSSSMRDIYDDLVDLKPSAETTLPAAQLPLIGRDKEWKLLTNAWRASRNGGPSLVLVEGEAGIGKSRLAEELFAWVERQGHRAAIARCYPVENGLAYAAVTRWLRRFPLPKLEPFWLSEISRLLPEARLGHPEVPPPPPIRQDWHRGRFHEALTRALLGGSQPMLLVLDDAQWCDAESLAWMHSLLRYDSGACLLVVATLRSEETDSTHTIAGLLSSIRRSRQLVEIALGPLDESGSRDLASQASKLPLSLEQNLSISREAEGNPLFIVELARASVPTAFVHADAVSSPSAPDLPPVIQTVIAERLALLSPQARKMIELAAVIGRQFDFRTIKGTYEADEQQLVNCLDELWFRRIIREQAGDTYDFSHDMIRQIVYHKVSHTRRRWLHRQVAEALERLYSTHSESRAGEIARHYEHADMAEKAVQGYRAAANGALNLYANLEALDWLGKAKRLVPKLGHESDRRRIMTAICESQGDVLKILHQSQEAIQDYQQAFQSLTSFEQIDRARLSRKQGEVWVEDHQYDPAWECFVHAQLTLESDLNENDLAWQREWLQVRLAQMHWHYWTNQALRGSRSMAEIAAQILPWMEQVAAPLQQVDYYHLLAMQAFLQAGFLGSDATCATALKSLQAARIAGDQNAILTTQFSYGFQLLWTGYLEPAADQISTALDAAYRQGDLTLETQCLTYLTICERRRGNLAKVTELAQASFESAQACRRRDYLGVALANQAWLAWKHKDLELASRLGLNALDTWNVASHPYPIQWLGIWPVVAARLAQGQVEEAISLARRLMIPGQQYVPVDLAALIVQVAELSEAGDMQGARTWLENVLALAQEKSYL